MSRCKRWLYNKFLPAWCKDDLLEKNRKLEAAIGEQKQKIEALQAYIEGMERALRWGGGRR